MKKEAILVIGSNSFSGSHFVSEALRRGHDVCGISRSAEIDLPFRPYAWIQRDRPVLGNFRFLRLDLNTQIEDIVKLIEETRPDRIINFAAQGMVAQSWDNPTDWYETNVVAQVRLHDRIRNFRFIKKYVHVTTPEVYGSTEGRWITEDHRFNPSTPYAVSRAACDMHLESFFKAYDFPVVFTRAANVYGPGQQLYRVIPRAFLSTRTGSKMELHGGGTSVRSFIHIQDVVEATLKLAFDAEAGSCWHLSTRQSISIKRLIERICMLSGVLFDDVAVMSGERLGKDQDYLLDSTRIKRIHQWESSIDLEEGLEQTSLWIDTYLEQLRNKPWGYKHKK